MAIDLTQMQHPLGLRRLGYASPLLEVPARRWEGGQAQERTEQVAEETPVAIVYNGIPHVVMMATPSDLEDFALGFSITEELEPVPGGPDVRASGALWTGNRDSGDGLARLRGDHRLAQPPPHRQDSNTN